MLKLRLAVLFQNSFARVPYTRPEKRRARTRCANLKAALFYAKNLMSWQYAGLDGGLPFRRGAYYAPAP